MLSGWLGNWSDLNISRSNSPEKEHATQLRALSHLFTAHPEYRGAVDPKKTIRLVMMGSSRNVADDARVKELQRLAKELDVVVSACHIALRDGH
jgi:hypothetical protein